MPLGEKTKLLWQNPEYRQHMVEAHKGNKGYWTGKKLSPEHREKCKLGILGKSSWNKGIPMSDISKKRLKLTFKKIGHTFTKLTQEQENKRIENLRKGKKAIIGKYAKDKCCHWQGGISKLPYAFEFTKELKEKIRNRDNRICQNCNITEEEHLIVWGCTLPIHHIDYDKQNCKEDNLITVCTSCNTRANYNRSYWKEFYLEKILKLVRV